MKCFIIYDSDNPTSVAAANRCKASTDLSIELFQQTSPKTLKEDKSIIPNLNWTYPLNDEVRFDYDTGMNLRSYRTNNKAKIFACTISHARLWRKSIELQEEVMILEHDAIFTRKFEPFDWIGGALGLNDPRGATHSANFFHSCVSNTNGIQDAPWVKPRLEMPQGLAGNSAYIIKPYFAQKLLDKLKTVGAWPNDAIMCKQFFSKDLKVVYPYYTRVQGVESTTTL